MLYWCHSWIPNLPAYTGSDGLFPSFLPLGLGFFLDPFYHLTNLTIYPDLPSDTEPGGFGSLDLPHRAPWITALTNLGISG